MKKYPTYGIEKGDMVRYVGRAMPHLKGLVGYVVGITEVGFIRVSYPGRDGKITRLNPRTVEKVEDENA